MNPLLIQHVSKDFLEALSIVNKVGDIAEKINHHPDIKIHGYNHLEFTLFTHDEGKVTEKDVNLAEEIKNILSQY